MVALLITLGLACAADIPPPETETTVTLDAKAVGLLESPDTWCKGAKKLTKQGEAEAILPLLAAYESRAEDDKSCLLDAMEALGAVGFAGELATDADAERRRAGAHLMELFADPGHLGALTTLVADGDARVRKQAAWSLRTQKQTEAWEAACITALDAEDPEVRALMVQALARRRTDTARAALEARSEVETDPAVRKHLDAP